MPASQLNALPLMTAQSAASGGTVALGMGGGITRFWDSTALGITAANFAGDAFGCIVLLSNFISVYGCRSFSLLLTRTNAGVGIALSGISVRVQYRLNTADVPPTSFGAVTQNVDYTGSVTVHPGGNAILFPAMQAAAEVQRALVGWDDAAIGQAIFTGTPAMVGDNVRLFLNMGVAANNPGVANIFTAQLWGTS
jgi:hypothetical protein